MHDPLATISLDFLCCDGLGPEPGAAQVIDILQSSGGRFLDIMRNDLSPASGIDLSEQLVLLSYEHPLLAHDYWQRMAHWQGQATASDPGAASFGFFREQAWSGISIRQEVFQAERENLIAAGLRAFAKHCFRQLRPRFASIDYSGFNRITLDAVDRLEMPQLCWVNYWGPAYVEKIGVERLLTLPSGSLESLADGGVLYSVTEDFSAWSLANCRDVLKHLQPVFPNIERYYPRGEEFLGPESFDE